MQIGFHLTPFWSPTDRSPTAIIDEAVEVVRAVAGMGFDWVSNPTVWPQPIPSSRGWRLTPALSA